MRRPNPSYYLQAIRNLVRTPDFRMELASLINIDESVFRLAVTSLREFTGFLDSQSARNELSGRITEEVAGAIWNFARNCAALRVNFGCTSHELTDLLLREIRRRQAEPNETPFPEETLQIVGTRIAVLAEPFRGIEQQMKAVALTEATSNRLQDMSIVCDVRPVFDEDRSRIEGLFPVVTLQLTVETSRGSEKVDAVLSPEQVNELAELAVIAKRKVDALRELTAKCRAFGIEGPEVWEA